LTCEYNANATAIKLVSFSDVAPGSEEALKAAVAGNGPVSIAIDASHYSFQVCCTLKPEIFVGINL